MKKYHRVGFTAAQSAELWERWKKGEGLKSIGIYGIYPGQDRARMMGRGGAIMIPMDGFSTSEKFMSLAQLMTER